MMGVSVCSWPPSLLPRSPPSLKRFGVYSSSSPQSLCPTRETTLSIIHNSGVIACLRANSAELAFEAASAALRGGISVLEIVMSTPGVFQVLQQLVQDHPTVALGVGTLLNVEDAMKAKSAGAKFLMSPAMVMGIMDVTRDGEILYIPGAMTPTEILSAYDAGSKIVKILYVTIYHVGHHRLFCLMPYLIKRQWLRKISMQYINLQALLLCREKKLYYERGITTQINCFR
ncbi:uncharacterized protein LOC110667123 isoform X4 [Hevea brasiliensis]|uniref:uncharacterized protein LOC110667123 isoform X4 n=1 Tax=Hevea brasiliensis TaxID=3981 RepID=UPI0025EFC6CF|nr:uncharacterized protein LOC110667123 isoform X4 [Hevea brasiliensis]